MDSCDCNTNVFENQHFSLNEKLAYNKGYRVRNGITYSPNGKKINQWVGSNGYFIFSLPTGSRKDGSRKMLKVSVHRLVAYQKYGDLLYSFQCIRHMDDDKGNNYEENIQGGTYLQNNMDKPRVIRKAISINASTHVRKFTDNEMEQIRQEHTSYHKTMTKWGITSKGTLHHILHNGYVTRKAG